MAEKRVVFGGWVFPAAFLAPQLAITAIFFFWPALQAVRQSLYREDAFGFGSVFVGLANFAALFRDPNYLASFQVTIIFSIATTILGLVTALILAVAVNGLIRGSSAYTTLLVWPYAVAPALAGVLWWFLFNPSIGIVAYMLDMVGIDWNHLLNGRHALILIVIASAWKQIAYNFLFFLAGLHAIPQSLIEAAAIDGASPLKRFLTITLPLLSPTTFYLIVVNVVYAFFDTFGVVHATTAGGPGQATTILVYKAYADGFLGLNFSSSAAQSVILTLIVVALTVAQFRFIERRVHY
jgi:sn-glycerol 3-phosphate transport system permease protein